MVMTWDLGDSRHQVMGRDNTANFHRMLFHGLRSTMDWFGDVEWQWFHDQKTDLDQEELKAFINNTRGYRAMSGMPTDLFGDARHFIRLTKVEQRCSKTVPLISLADCLAGAVRHSVHDGPECVRTHRNREGQAGFEFDEIVEEARGTRGIRAKREMVSFIRTECGRRSLGVSLESTNRLETHRKGNKVWFWHYQPQGTYDKAPVKNNRPRSANLL